MRDSGGTIQSINIPQVMPLNKNSLNCMSPCPHDNKGKCCAWPSCKTKRELKNHRCTKDCIKGSKDQHQSVHTPQDEEQEQVQDLNVQLLAHDGSVCIDLPLV